MSVEAVDSYLGEAAVLAVVFHSDSGLEVESVGKRACSYIEECVAREHVDERCAFATACFGF